MEYPIEMVPMEQTRLESGFKIGEEPEIDKMAESIKSKGLLHPLTGYRKDGEVIVFAGKKRLAACLKLQLKEVRVMILPGEPTELEREEVHLHENLFRLNLPWWEQVELERKFHELRQKQKGEGRSGKKTGWSLRDTAEELGTSLGGISQDLRLAEALLSNPHLKKITDKGTAMRLVMNEYKRQEAEVEAGLDAPSGAEIDVAWFGDASEILQYYPNNTFNACITDPPWLRYKDEKLTKDERTVEVFKQVYRVLKHGSFLYAFVSTPDFELYKKELPKFGFKVQEMPLIWIKEGVITHGLRSWEYARDYEPILLAVKGTPALVNTGQTSSIFSFPAIHPTRLIHPHEKPIGLIKRILDHCTYEGSLVLDPFGGSGVTAHACKESKRRYVTVEREKSFYDNIAKRLGQDRPLVDGAVPPKDGK